MLLALKRLPRPTPGVAVALEASSDFQDETTIFRLFVSAERFELDYGGIVYSPAGSDHRSIPIFHLEKSGSRTSDMYNSPGWIPVSEWVERFRDLLSDEHEISIEDLSDEEKIDWKDESDQDFWSEIAKADE